MSGQITHLILKVAELCNLNCSYCYMYQHEDKTYLHRPKFMSDEVFEHVLLRAREYTDRHALPSIMLAFHGGEPTLIGADRLRLLARRAREVLGERLEEIRMQTNATLLTQDLVEALKSAGIGTGVSLDGPPAVHDAQRVDYAGRGSHHATLRGIRLLQAAGLEPGIICVVDPGADGLAAYRYFRSVGIKKVSYLLPDVSHDNKARLYGRYGETPIANYLLPIFDEWFAEDNPVIKLEPFWSLLRSMLGTPSAGGREDFGNPLMSYLVIETDGSIRALDALKVCAESIDDSGLNVLQHGFDDLHLGSPLIYQLVHQGATLSATCRSCPEVHVCGGGYLPHRYARANGFDNPSVWCQDLLQIIHHIRSRIL